MVRLKAASSSFPAFLRAFQFQYGSIKSLNINSKMIMCPLFQFQYGSIKSKPQEEWTHEVANFNSNMVRLKAQKHYS